MNTVTALYIALSALCIHLAVSSDEGRGISVQTTQFSLDILKALPLDKTRNLVMSPLSVYALLAVLQQGSSGVTKDEIGSLLHAPPEATREALRNLTASIEQSDTVSSFRFMWKSRIKGNHNFKPEFQQVIRQGLKPKFQPGKSNPAKPSSPPLRGMLSKIVVPSKSAKKTLAALANLLYFNGHWAHDELTPGHMTFKPAPGEEMETPALLMKKTCFSGTSAEVGAKWIHVPVAVQKKNMKIGVMPSGPYWSRRSLSLMLMLPTEQHSLDSLVQKLTPELLIGFFNYTTTRDRKDLELAIPTFHVNASSNFKPVLKKLGLRSAFESGAGLSDISTGEQLYVSKITQKGQFIVDEFGARTEEQTNINFPYHYHEPWGDTVPFRVDEPFLFFLVDRTHLLPLFVGKISRPEPSKWSPYKQDDALQFPQY